MIVASIFQRVCRDSPDYMSARPPTWMKLHSAPFFTTYTRFILFLFDRIPGLFDWSVGAALSILRATLVPRSDFARREEPACTTLYPREVAFFLDQRIYVRAGYVCDFPLIHERLTRC